jgi:hypothetical protein
MRSYECRLPGGGVRYSGGRWQGRNVFKNVSRLPLAFEHSENAKGRPASFAGAARRWRTAGKPRHLFNHYLVTQ